MELLFNIFKVLGMVAGILFFLSIIICVILVPFKEKRKQKNKEKFFRDLEKITNECIEELKKQENKPKKTTRKPRNTKKNVEN